MDEDVALLEEIAQSGLIEKPGELHLARQSEFRRQHLDRLAQRTFTGYGKSGAGTPRRESRERLERHIEALFFDEPAGLDEIPTAIGRAGAFDPRECLHRNSSAIQAKFFRGTTERHQP